jgi:hypothetical protein
MRAEPRGPSQEFRSQLALELVLNGYAICGALIIFRTLLKTLGVNSDRWVGSAVYGITDVIAFPLTKLPGSGTQILGDLTLADATLMAFVVLFPLGLLVLGNYRSNH